MSRRYLMWKNRGKLRFRMLGDGDRVTTLNLNAGREEQLYRLIAGWMAQDRMLHTDDESVAARDAAKEKLGGKAV